jgi:uncharacterized short protein YbdD (DUF466 family)
MRDRSGAAEWRRGRAALEWLLSVIQQVSGMPDYKAYVDHVCKHHPGAPVLTEPEYYAEYLQRRYEDGPSRCC